MALKRKSTPEEIEKEIEKQYKVMLKGMIDIMKYVGEEFSSNAKNSLKINPALFPKGDYTNRTNNLRSSIGYFILLDGEVIDDNIDGRTKVGRTSIELLNLITKGGLQLIGVAGMEYASTVESKGYNVITSQEAVALVDLEKDLKDYAKQRGVGINISKSFRVQ